MRFRVRVLGDLLNVKGERVGCHWAWVIFKGGLGFMFILSWCKYFGPFGFSGLSQV